MSEKKRRLAADFNFEIEEVVENLKDNTHPNYEAWKYLHSSMCTPDFNKDNHIRTGKYKYMLYPVCMDEVNEMEKRLNLAELSQQVEDDRFSAILNEMKSIVKWSKTKHFNCSFLILISFYLLMPLYFLLCGGVSDRKANNVEDLRNTLLVVNAWNDKDTTLTPEQSYEYKYTYDESLKSPTSYKYYYLYQIAHQIKQNRDDLSCNNSENKDKVQKQLDENLKEFDHRNSQTTKELKEQIVESIEDQISEQEFVENKVKLVSYILYLLLPLYLLSCYQYGYNINRFLQFRESIHKLCFIGSGVVAVGAAMPSYVEKVRYSDGSSSTNVVSPGLPVMAIGFLTIVFCSSLALFILTINGLYYNYIEPRLKIQFSLFDNEKVEKGSIRYYFNCAMKIAISNYRKLYDFDGRENRLSYSVFLLVNLLMIPILFLFVSNSMMILIPFFIIALLSSLVRRVHDIGCSSKWVLLLVVFPIFLPALLVALMFIPGTDGVNKYGERSESVL